MFHGARIQDIDMRRLRQEQESRLHVLNRVQRSPRFEMGNLECGRDGRGRWAQIPRNSGAAARDAADANAGEEDGGCNVERYPDGWTGTARVSGSFGGDSDWKASTPLLLCSLRVKKMTGTRVLSRV